LQNRAAITKLNWPTDRRVVSTDTLTLARWACPGFVDRLALSVLFFSHNDDDGLW